MKRFLLIFGLLGCAWAQTTTTITGTIKDLTGALVTSGKVVFTLTPNRDTTISGVARFTPTSVVCLINGSGLIKAQDGVSVCTLTMNTALQPTGTYYTVAVWPNNVKTAQFTFYAVNASYDWSTVVPTPTTSPAQNYADVFSNQTIGGTKTFTSPVTFSGGVAGPLNAANIESTFYADQFAGATPSIQINAAMAACPVYSNASTGLGCVVVIPATMACGEPNQAKDNVLLLDYRGCAQSQGLRFNVPVAATSIRSKMLLQDNYDLGTIGATSGGHGAVTGYFLSYPDSPNLAANTVEALNGTISINSLTGHMTQTLVGVEAEAFANPVGGGFTVDDVRGLTANSQCGATGAVTCTQLVSAYAQAPVKGAGGTVTNAYSLLAQEPTLSVGGEKKSVLAQSSRFGDLMSIGSASANNSSVGLSIFDPNSISGTNQFGIQSALQSTSAATSEGAGGVFRADVAAATTQALNEGIAVQTPTLHAGSVITTWDGLHIQKAPTAGTACSLAIDGSTSGSTCLNAPATGGVTNTLPSVAGTIVVKIGSGTATMTTGAIGAGSCGATVTVGASGVLTTDAIEWSYSAAPAANPAELVVSSWPTANNVNFQYCNPSAGSVTPNAATLNWRVAR